MPERSKPPKQNSQRRQGVNDAWLNGLGAENGGGTCGQHGLNFALQKRIVGFDERHPLIGPLDLDFGFPDGFLHVKWTGEGQHRTGFKPTRKTVE